MLEILVLPPKGWNKFSSIGLIEILKYPFLAHTSLAICSITSFPCFLLFCSPYRAHQRWSGFLTVRCFLWFSLLSSHRRAKNPQSNSHSSAHRRYPQCYKLLIIIVMCITNPMLSSYEKIIVCFVCLSPSRSPSSWCLSRNYRSDGGGFIVVSSAN